MNHEIRSELANTGLDILKKSVLLVLYERTDTGYKRLPLSPTGRPLTQGKIREFLRIRRPHTQIQSIRIPRQQCTTPHLYQF